MAVPIWYGVRVASNLNSLDEAQLEVSRKLVEMETFDTKEEAIAAKTEMESSGKLWSDVGHYKNKYYIGYCRAGELAVESVLEAGRYYKLNVDLTAGYMLGNSWATCH